MQTVPSGLLCLVATTVAETVVVVVVQVDVVGLVLLVIGELGMVLVHDLGESRRLLLSRVLVGVEVGDFDSELVLVGIGNLDVVLIGEEVAVVALERSESECLTSLSQVRVLIRVLGFSSRQVVGGHRVLVRVLVLGGGIRLLVLRGLTVVGMVEGRLAQARVVVVVGVVVVVTLVRRVVSGIIASLDLLIGLEVLVDARVVLAVAWETASTSMVSNLQSEND